MITDIFIEILHEALLLLLISGSLIGLLVAIFLLISPQNFSKLSRYYNRWISLRQPTKGLEVPRSTDRYFYRYHRIVGLFIILSAAYILYRFAFDFDRTSAINTLLRIFSNQAISAWAVDALLWFLMPISLMLTIFGAALALKPSSLKSIEKQSNRWISSRKGMQPLEKQYKIIDQWVEEHPRIFGTLLLVGSGYSLILLLIVLSNNVL